MTSDIDQNVTVWIAACAVPASGSSFLISRSAIMGREQTLVIAGRTTMAPVA